MRLPALIHLIEAVRVLTQCETVTVLGSAALLATDAALGEPDGPLEVTRDADLLVSPVDEQLAAVVHEGLGQGSLFDRRNGYHVDLMRPEIVESLPRGWQTRLVAIRGALALAVADVAAVKLYVAREKDIALVGALLRAGLADPADVLGLLLTMGRTERETRAAVRRLHVLRGA